MTLYNGLVRLKHGHYRYTEERIYAGDRLYVVGGFRTKGELEREGERSRLAQGLLREWKRRRTNLLARFDRDGEIDAGEWDVALRSAARQAATAHWIQLRGRFPHTVRAAPGRPFLISSLSQFTLVKRFRLFAGIALGLFFLGGGAAAWMLFRS